jgi:hypothetical protein
MSRLLPTSRSVAYASFSALQQQQQQQQQQQLHVVGSTV